MKKINSQGASRFGFNDLPKASMLHDSRELFLDGGLVGPGGVACPRSQIAPGGPQLKRKNGLHMYLCLILSGVFWLMEWVSHTFLASNTLWM